MNLARGRILWQIALPLAVLLAVGLFAVSWQASRLMRASHNTQIESQLDSSSALVDEALGDQLLLLGGNTTEARRAIDPVAKRLGSTAALRVTVIAVNGDVLGESDGDPGGMDNHGTRPEVLAAIEHGHGAAVRHSDTLSDEMLYAARAVHRDGKLVGVVRTGVLLSALQEADRRLRGRTAAAALLIALLTLSCGFWLARRVTRPLEELEQLADGYARGQLDLPRTQVGSIEVERVADAMQRMARELDRRIGALVAERNEQEAVLSSMVEGVLAIDADERVMALNPAGAELLEVGSQSALGRTIHEVARNADLQAFVTETLGADNVLERTVTLHGDTSRFIQLHGAPVRNAKGDRIGAVVVLHDVTRIRRLETMRSDFVANVSHELKTPVTSIKGFLETLLGGAMDDPANARRFLEIAARQAERLGAIIEDLLVLSRIDQEAGQQLIEKTPMSIEPVVEGAVEVCRFKAEEKGVVLRVECQPGLAAPINGALVEQALVNLIYNAIKFSNSKSTVEVEATTEDGYVILRVRDQGTGIDSEHLPRLFERFYRVDKARSRALGGTGLGLAIVKHIAQSQGGTVDVVSTPGSGSTFTLRFPLA